jgi:hypothetical protein
MTDHKPLSPDNKTLFFLFQKARSYKTIYGTSLIFELKYFKLLILMLAGIYVWQYYTYDNKSNMSLAKVVFAIVGTYVLRYILQYHF